MRSVILPSSFSHTSQPTFASTDTSPTVHEIKMEFIRVRHPQICYGTDKLCLKIRTIKKATLLLRHCEVQGIMVVLKVENNTTTEWPEPRATNCSEFTQTIGMAASPFLVLVSLLRSRQRLSLLALAHVKVLLLACSRQGSHGSMLAFLSLVPIQNSSYKIRNGLGANREPL